MIENTKQNRTSGTCRDGRIRKGGKTYEMAGRENGDSWSDGKCRGFQGGFAGQYAGETGSGSARDHDAQRDKFHPSDHL